jgi:hypothetical protein
VWVTGTRVDTLGSFGPHDVNPFLFHIDLHPLTKTTASSR